MNKILAYILLVGSLLFSAWAFRWSVLQPTDYLHLKNRFDHSQWRIPLSTRIISDEELYVVAGTEIIHGENLFSINPEAPPLGKYLYGLSYVKLGNPYWASFGLYGCLLLVLAVIAHRRFHHPVITWLTVWWASLSAILVTQVGQTMLDLPQAVLLLIHVGLLSELLLAEQRTRKVLLALLAGLALGLFAAVKVPILAPLVLGLGILFLLAQRQWLSVVMVVAGATASYLVTFFPYFLAGHSFFDWLGTQKWMVTFYLSSQTSPAYGMYWVTLLTGWFTDGTHPAWLRASEWSLGWPLVVGGSLAVWWSLVRAQLKAVQTWQTRIRRLATPEVYLCSLVMLFSLVYTILPFNARYFVLIFPLALLSVGPWLTQLIKKPRAHLFLGMISLVLAGELLIALRPQPLERLQFFALDLELGNAQDAYSYLEPATTSFSRQSFWQNLKTTQLNLQSKKQTARLSAPYVWPWQKKVVADLSLTWHTPIGPVSQTVPVTLVRVQNQWRVQWQWSVMHPDYDLNSTLRFTPEYPVGGLLRSPTGSIISRPGKELMLKLTPSQLVDREALTPAISLATGVSPVELEKRLYLDAYPNSPISIGKIKPQSSSQTLRELRQAAGVQFDEIAGRSYTPDLKSGFSIDTTQHFENTYPIVFGKVGGKIELVSESSPERVLYTVSPQPGQDVQLTAADVSK